MKKIYTLVFVLIGIHALAQEIMVSPIGRYTDGREGACEISVYDNENHLLFVTNSASDSVMILNIENPNSPTLVSGVSVLNYGGGANSVASIGNGNFAVAIEAEIKQDSGRVVIFDSNANPIISLVTGALPDMLCLSPNGQKLLVANEGEPNDDFTNDPIGSISIIDLPQDITELSQNNVTILDFTNAPTDIEGIIKSSPSSVAQDLEPEYIAISSNSQKAVVICQESNVFVFIDLQNNSISGYKALGFKDHNLAINSLDVSDKDSSINISTWNVMAAYQPDGMASLTINDTIYWLSANEGDGKDYDGYSSECRVDDLTLDSIAYPNFDTLQSNEMLGRLKTFTPDVLGDNDGDGYVEQIYAYGGRSFSIWNESGELVYDSGNDFESFIADNYPDYFNCSDGCCSKFDKRSDDKGCEPEAITIGQIGDQWYAFIGLERQSGVMIYNVTNPHSPYFVDFIESYDAEESVDIGPEGILFISASESPNDNNLLIISNEDSGTVAIYQLDEIVNVTSQSADVLHIYPNPCKSTLYIDREESFNYSIINSLGQTVKYGVANEFIDINDLSKGNYQLEIQSNKTKHLHTFIKW